MKTSGNGDKIVYQPVNPNTYGIGHDIYKVVGGIMTIFSTTNTNEINRNLNIIKKKMTKITAVIPIRSGSQRVKEKNLRPFANTTLMENKIEMLLNVPELDSIIVNTNSEEAIEIINKCYSGGKIY